VAERFISEMLQKNRGGLHSASSSLNNSKVLRSTSHSQRDFEALSDRQRRSSVNSSIDPNNQRKSVKFAMDRSVKFGDEQDEIE